MSETRFGFGLQCLSPRHIYFMSDSSQLIHIQSLYGTLAVTRHVTACYSFGRRVIIVSKLVSK